MKAKKNKKEEVSLKGKGRRARHRLDKMKINIREGREGQKTDRTTE